MPGKGFLSTKRHDFLALAVASLLAATMVCEPNGAYALTDNKTLEQIGKDEPDKQNPPASEDEEEDLKQGIPMPDSLVKKPGDATKAEEPQKPAEIILDLNTLPEPVKKLRVAIVEAAASGDIERLRPLMSTGPDQTQISIGEAPEDPIAALKSLSGDGEGREVLAILLDIISTGAARVDAGTPEETYVWPYFAEKPLDQLSPPEIVELYRIVTASDVADMKEFGGYNFYRIGISSDGKWKFFVAGD